MGDQPGSRTPDPPRVHESELRDTTVEDRRREARQGDDQRRRPEPLLRLESPEREDG